MTKDIVQEVEFDATPERIWTALMDSDQHGAFTGGPARISGEVGGAFSCHGGRVSGVNVDLVPQKRIVQAWRVDGWPEGVFSVVRFDLAAADGGKTKLTMTHSGVPADATPMIADGWRLRYWEPLRTYLG